MTLAPALTARLNVVAKHTTSSADEDEVARALARERARQVGGKKRRERHGPALVRLGRAPGEVSPDVDDVLGDFDAPPIGVDTADLERGELAPAQAGVREDEDDAAQLPRADRERVHLPVGEVGPLLAQPPRQRDALGGVPDEPSVSNGVGQDHAEDVVRPPNRGRPPVA